MNALSFLTILPSTVCSMPGVDPSLADAVHRFLAVDRLYDEPVETIVAFEYEHVVEWDKSLDGVAVRPAATMADCAAKAQALVASIRREMPDDETEKDLPPQMALAWAMCADLLRLAGGAVA